MIAILQRVSEARVTVADETVGQIAAGLLVLACVEQGDSEWECDKMLSKLLKLRIFNDEAGKMNHSVQNLDGRGTVGELLLVSQFTLAADVSAGNRPGFTAAAKPDEGRRLYDYFVAQARLVHPVVQTGQYQTDMRVHLVNDGPVTIPLRIVPATSLLSNK